MAAVEHLSGRDDIPEGVYLDACNALKQLHSVTKLFRVTYHKFYVDRDEMDVQSVLCKTETIIMEQREDDVDLGMRWWHVFRVGKLPRDMSGLHVDGKPFTKDNSQIVVTAVEPYLKRTRDTDDQ